MCYGKMLVRLFHELATPPRPNRSDVDFQDDMDEVNVDDVGCPTVVGATDAVSLAGPASASSPRPVAWPCAWTEFVATVRGAGAPMFLECFSGTEVMSNEMRAAGYLVAPPVDVATTPEFNLLDPMFLMILVGLIKERRFFLIHFAPPCSSFSIALNSDPNTAVRSDEFPEGFPYLTGRWLDKVVLGNALSDVTIVAMTAQHETGSQGQAEQPWTSIMLKYPPFRDFMAKYGYVAYRRDACVDGAPWRKPMAIITCIESVGNKIWATCRGCESHIQLRGMGPGGVLWTRIACPYWPKWARSVVSAWRAHLRPILENYGEFGPPTLFVPSCGED